jgi:hypothetical protein
MEYSEDGIWNKKSYTLNEDQIIFRGRNWVGSRSELTFLLADLSPVYDRWWLRELRYWIVALLFIVIVGSLLLWPVYYLEFDMRIYWGLTISLVVLFAAFAVFWPPTEYVAFKWKTGVTALSVGRRGRDKTRFDEFVSAIQQAILARSTG